MSGLSDYQRFVLGKIGIDCYIKTNSADNAAIAEKPCTNIQEISSENINQIPKKDSEIKQKSLTKTIITKTTLTNNDKSGKLPENYDWQSFSDAVKNCTKCALCKERKQAVIGVGDLQPEWLFVGEAPGAEEDARGEPFVGNSGKLLDNALYSVGLVRGAKVYIANAIKCRPPANRPPSLDEISACQNFLKAQINLLQPKIIVAVGKTAAVSLIGDDKTPLGKLRSRVFKYPCANGEIPIVVTYHPSYLIRNLTDKLRTWEDLVFAISTLAKK